MSKPPFALRSAALCALVALAACSERGPLEPALQPTVKRIAELSCTADITTRTVACSEPVSGGGYRPLMVGGQNVYTLLTSTNVATVADTFRFDVTVKNLIPQSLGTTDGTTLDPDGVQVFFASGPRASGGTGQVTVANADGVGTFTTSGQPYFQYNQVLAQGQTSNPKTWKLKFDPGVTQIAFKVYINAAVAKPNGWVDVKTLAPYILAGGQQTLRGVVRNVVGDSIGATVTWGTSSASVATVDAAGNVTAVAPGAVQITATSGLATGTASASVCPNLAVGEAYATTMPAAASLCLGGGAGAQEYTYMPINTSSNATLGLTVTGSGIIAASGPPTPNLVPNTGLRLLRSTESGPQPGSDVDFLERDARELSGKLGNSRALVSRGRRGAGQPGLHGIITQNAVPALGDSMDLNTNSACSGTPSIRRGVVKTVSQHLIIVADTANPAGGFTTAQYDSIALEFDTIAWPVDSANFGPPTDIDGNGHVVAFFTRAVNELTPPNNSSYVLGFFASKDIFSTDPVDGCSNSNAGEMFYMLVPDLTGAVNGNVRDMSTARGNTTGTLGHEFQHMINAFRRGYVTGASFFESGYLNEGLSHIAEELMFYRASGMVPGSNIGRGSNAVSGIQASSKRVNAYNAYSKQNIGRFAGFLQRPDTTGALKNNANSLAVRGAIWAFLRYAADRQGGNQQQFWYNMVNDNLQGTANIQHVIGNAPPTEWLRDFTAALYADDNAFTVASQYKTLSWNYRDFYGLLYGSYILQTRALTNNTGLALTYGVGGGTMYARFGTAASTFGNVTALTTGSGAIPTAPFQLIVVRTK
jgi:hypothetical protein